MAEVLSEAPRRGLDRLRLSPLDDCANWGLRARSFLAAPAAAAAAASTPFPPVLSLRLLALDERRNRERRARDGEE